MQYSTGLDKFQFLELCERVRAVAPVSTWPPSLGLKNSLRITLTYLRQNRVEQELAEQYGVSQPTVSRAITAMSTLLEKVLAEFVPVADDLDPAAHYVIDGTLAPCWSWAGQPELYSGKHKTTGYNLQVAADLAGRIAWVSDPLPGRTHDIKALRAHGILEMIDPAQLVADKGYIGAGMITPLRKPINAKLSEHDKQFNHDVNTIRYVIERAIAHLKTWKALHTDYRRPLATFRQAITNVIGLLFFRGGDTICA